MKMEMMGSRWFGRVGVALGALSLGLLVTGCEPECVDQFDCASKGSPGEGKRYVCESNRCVVRDVTSDAGTDAGADAGTDAGVACADLPHDPKLGTLQLQEGYAAATETATLPEGIGAVSAIQSGSEFKLYGLNETDNSLYALGTWPNVALGATPLQNIFAPDDRAESAKYFPSGFLTNDGTRLLTGYTKSFTPTGTPGTILVYDTVTPTNSQYLSAPGNYSAAGLSDAFLINGQGLEGTSEGGNAIYALKTGTQPFVGSKLATFPKEGVYSSATAVASNGVAVLGYSEYPVDTLRAVAPATYSPALTNGTTLALTNTNAPEIFSGEGLKSVAGFGEGVALHRGSFTSTKDVSHIPLTLDGITPGSVTVGDLKAVLTTSNTCTNVVLMAPMGSELLVGVADKNGRRLVLLKKQ